MKKNIETVLKLLLLLIILFDFNGKVTAEGDGSTSGQEEVTNSSCTNSCFPKTSAYGVRITIVNDEGKILSESKDFLNAGFDNDNVFTLGGGTKRSKAYYLTGGSAGGWSQSGYSHESSSTYFGRNVPNYATSALTKYAIKDFFLQLTRSQIQKIFTHVGYKGNYATFQSNGDKMMVETLAYMKYNKNYYIGTGTEFAYLLSLQEAKETYISSMTHDTLAWGIYLEDQHGIFAPASGDPGDRQESQTIISSGLGVGLFWDFTGPVPERACKNVDCEKLKVTSNTSTCDEGGTYRDPDDWKCCIMGKEDYLGNENDGGKKPYCPVYCREDLYTYFANPNITVASGKHFVLRTIAGYNSTVECQANIQRDSWLADYEDNNENLDHNYKDYVCTDNVRASGGAHTVAYYDGSSPIYSCPNGGLPDGGKCIKCITNCYGKTSCCETSNASIVGYTYHAHTSSSPSVNCAGDVSNTSFTASSESEVRSMAQTHANNINGKYGAGKIGGTLSAIKNKHDGLVEKRTSLQEQIYACQSTNQFGTVEPNSAEFKLYYDYKIVNDKYEKIETNTQTFWTKSAAAHDNDNKKLFGWPEYDYNLQPGNVSRKVRDRFEYPLAKWVQQYYYISSDTTMSDDTYRYVLKTNGKSITSKKQDMISNYSGLYYDIGYGNLPVHYNLKAGTYNYYIEYGITGSVKDQLSGQFMDSHPSTVEIDGGQKVASSCPYKVENKIFGDVCKGKNPPAQCDDENIVGIDIVYRTIDLNQPFPSINSDGREAGSNWSGAGYSPTVMKLDSKDQLKEWYITNNRGVVTDAVYSLQPMYEITLTPALIRTIRNHYNLQRDQLNDQTEYADFNFTCETDPNSENLGKQCKSIFLRSTFIKEYMSGCGLSDNWNYCDELDGHVRSEFK